VPDDFVFVPKHKSNAYYVAEDPGARLGITAGALHSGPMAAGSKRGLEGGAPHADELGDDDGGGVEG